MYLNARKNNLISNVQTLALRNRYFCAIIEPVIKANYSVQIEKINAQESEISLKSQGYTVAPGQALVQKFHIYLGPQELRIIKSINENWSLVVHYGAFNFISHLLLQLLGFLYSLVHNWGLAIILLSLAVYFTLYPLTLKQMRSMKEMQALQPHIEELRQKHKDNPQKLNKEIMELYREHKVNPFGGCLPLILQIPIFFALYQALMRTVSLKGAHFLWIKDLASPDKLITLSNTLPVIGNEINILPLIMTVIMFLQQKMSLASASGAAQEQQKMMLVIFPLMFAVIFYHMPAGLVLYWLVNSALMFLYQLRVSRSK
jgi:YidC/Oxa1 family membrane protein insertase